MHRRGPQTSVDPATQREDHHQAGPQLGGGPRAATPRLSEKLERTITTFGDRALERLGDLSRGRGGGRGGGRKYCGGRSLAQALLRGACALQICGVEPTTSALSEACRIAGCHVTRAQVDGVLQRQRLDGLPAAVFQTAVDRGVLAAPDAIYVKSWPAPAFGPDKFGVDSPVPPRISASELLKIPGHARNCTAATSSAYAIACIEGRSFVVGHVPTALGWWAPEKWRPYLEGTNRTVDDIEDELRQASGFLDTRIPFVTTAGMMVAELVEQISHVRDGLAWKTPLPRGLYVRCGEMSNGATHEEMQGFGLTRSFASQESPALGAILKGGMTPMLDLPRDPHALRKRGGFDRVPWEMDWQLTLGDHTVSIPDLQEDLVALDGSAPASRWWKSFDQRALQAAGVHRHSRYHWVRGQMYSTESGTGLGLTLIARWHRGMFRGWVTSCDPRHHDASRQLERQAKLIEGCERQIEMTAQSGPVEEMISLLHELGWAQRGRRRSYQERINISALASASRTIINLAD